MILVVGHLVVEPNHRERVLDLARSAVIAARSTQGCIDFAVAADLIDPARINVCEQWADRDSLTTFRGDGPASEQDELIRAYSVEEYEV